MQKKDKPAYFSIVYSFSHTLHYIRHLSFGSVQMLRTQFLTHFFMDCSQFYASQSLCQLLLFYSLFRKDCPMHFFFFFGNARRELGTD